MFKNFLEKSKNALTPKKIPLSQLIGYISKIPLLGKQMVREAARRSSQRHKCAGCGMMVEVCVTHIIDDPLALLSDAGRVKLLSDRSPEASSLNGASTAATTTDSTATASSAHVPPLAENGAAATTSNGCVEELSPEELAALVAALPEPTESIASNSNEDTIASPAMDAGATIHSQKFTCSKCTGRLGVHCFPGDATNGSKRELMSKLFALFDAMPEVIAVSLPPEKVKMIDEPDIFWVD